MCIRDSSTAVVHFADGSRVKLHPNTEIAVDVFTLKNGGPPDGNRISKVRIINGGIDFDVVDIDSDESIWQFITHDGVVAIQGTAGTLISKNSMWVGGSPKVEGAKGGYKNRTGIPTVGGGLVPSASTNDNQVLDKPGPSKDDQRGNQQVDREDEKNDGKASQSDSQNESDSQSNQAGPTGATSEGTARYENRLELNLLDGKASIIHVDKEAQSITPVEITPGNKFTATYETDENVDAGSNTRNNLIEAASVILTNSEATEMAIKGELAPALNTALTAAEQNGLIKVDGATWVVAGGNDNQVLDKPGPSKDDQRGNQQLSLIHI